MATLNQSLWLKAGITTVRFWIKNTWSIFGSKNDFKHLYNNTFKKTPLSPLFFIKKKAGSEVSLEMQSWLAKNYS
jgi:hypothetical protein